MTAIVRIALRRPYIFVVLALLLLIIGPLAASRTPVDIFPEIGIRAWIDKNVEIEGKIQFQNEPIVIEHCHIGTIINGAQAAGLKVSVVAP